MVMRRYPPDDRRLPSTYVRRVGPSFPVPPSLPPGYGEALHMARRDIRAYSRHSQIYHAFGPIPRRPYGSPSGATPIVVPDQPTTETHGGKMMLTASLVIIVVVALGFGLASLIAPKPTPQLPPDTSYSVIGGPSVTADFINQVLDHYGSPAAGQGQALHDLGVKSGIDPVFALAFFMHESSFGKAGMATITLGLGNERCLSDRPCINTEGGPCQAGQSCYAQFSSWADGFEHWYQLIKDGYVGGQVSSRCPCTTIPQIIPVYAPSADHNNEGAYISSVENAVATWRSGEVAVS